MGRSKWGLREAQPPRLGAAGRRERLRPWEGALLLAVAAALAEGVFSPGAATSGAAATVNWWTVMFPGLSELPGAGGTSGGAETAELRWWIVELFRAVFRR